MKVVVQRVDEASVSVNALEVGKIGKGLLLLVGFTYDDNIDVIDYMVNKIINLRIFDDENGVMNLSLHDIGGEILSVSQFTLYGDAKKGNRPSYVRALKGEEAVKLYDIFNQRLQEFVNVEKGVFGADMKVSFINDGPVTILLEK